MCNIKSNYFFDRQNLEKQSEKRIYIDIIESLILHIAWFCQFPISTSSVSSRLKVDNCWCDIMISKEHIIIKYAVIYIFLLVGNNYHKNAFAIEGKKFYKFLM